MSRVRVLFAVSLATLALPALARASAYSQVLQAYQQKGTIPACRFTSAQLSSALRGVDTYGAQYFADFTAAIQNALAARASGQCSPGASSGPPAPFAGQAGSSGRAPALGRVTASTQAGVPAPIVLMALVAAAFAVVLAIGGLARLRGWDPAWTATWRHAWSEAGYRAGGIWSEFVDWIRAV